MPLPTSSFFDGYRTSLPAAGTVVDYNSDTAQTSEITGKAYIKEVTLIQKNGNLVSLLGVYSAIEFFEDIYATNISGSLAVNDSFGGLEKFYISGGEKLKIVVAKQINGEEIISRNDLVVYRVSEGELSRDNLTTTYTLNFVSESYVKSSKKKIFKSYYDKKINEIAVDIFSQMSTKSLSTEDLLNIKMDKPFVCTGQSPIQAMQRLAKIASSYGKYFTLFERLSPITGSTTSGTNFGSNYMFCSLERLKNTGSSAYQIVFAPKTNTLITDSTPDSVIRASQLIRLDNFNHMEYMFNGFYNSRITTLNHISRTYFVNMISHVSDDMPETILPEREFYDYKLIDTSSNNPFSQYNGRDEYPGEKYVAITVNDVVAKEKWMSKYNVGYMLSLLYRVQVVIDGSSNKLSCGDSVNLSIPSKYRQNSTQTGNPQLDEMMSGYYLVTSVRHVISNDGTYVKRVELGRGSSPVDLDKKFSLNNGSTPSPQRTFVSQTPPGAFNDVKPVVLPGTVNRTTNKYDGLPVFGSESLPPPAGGFTQTTVVKQQEVAQNKQTDTTETRTRNYRSMKYRGNIDRSGWYVDSFSQSSYWEQP